jgi:nitroimidazol reductase NimA-like FMN-containing flavoprotein (pyridoxamine 5'-phosphate oxidase superfamily)
MTSQPADEPETLLQEIEPTRCVPLLAATRFGRIAVVDAGRPVIVVLNHLVIDGDVVFRVGENSRLARLTDGYAVHASYEADSAFPVGHTGWSVIATGMLSRESDPLAVEAARGIAAWAGGRRETVLRLRVDEVTGRHAGGHP